MFKLRQCFCKTYIFKITTFWLNASRKLSQTSYSKTEQTPVKLTMPFIIGHFNIHSLLQQIFLIPTHCYRNSSSFYQNPKFFYPTRQLLWKVVQLIWITYIVVSIHSLFKLKQAWREGGNKNRDMEQFGVTVLISSMLWQVLTTMWTAEKYAYDMAWVVSNVAQMRGITIAGKYFAVN